MPRTSIAATRPCNRMKHIRLSVAQRYLRRYRSICDARGVRIECRSNTGQLKNPFFVRTQVMFQFTPDTDVYLKKSGQYIAKITQGLPKVHGRFNAATAEFIQEIPY